MKKKLFTALKIYIINWFVSFTLFLFLAMRRVNIKEAFTFFIESLGNRSFLIAIHTLFIILYILFFLFRYFFRVYKKKGALIAIKGFLIKIIIPISILYSSYAFVVYTNTNESYQYEWDTTVENQSGSSKELYRKDGKHRGASVFGWEKDNETAIDEMIKDNIEWAAVIPFIYQENEQSNSISIRSSENKGGWSKRDSSFIRIINQVHKKKLYVYLKPHLWLGEGWRSNINMRSKKDWDLWFTSYEERILHYAKMAAETGTELFCIGTELRTSIKEQPEKWKNLIKKIRAIYKGKLTYAANWDDTLDQISFWEDLDYIGVQAYFPLTKGKKPELSEIKEGWRKHATMLKTLSEKRNTPVLFTEIGYKRDLCTKI